MSKQANEISLRLDLPGGRLGPGKAALLGAIGQAGSVSGAARTLGMSYPRALRLIGEMNTQFDVPLVVTFQGGAARGGASLTPRGEQVLDLYERICSAAQNATSTDRHALRKLSAPKA